MSTIKNIFYLLGSARKCVSLRLDNVNERIKDAKDMVRIKWTRISIERLEHSLNRFTSHESQDAKKVRKQLLLEYETLISNLHKNADIHDAAFNMLCVYGSDNLKPYFHEALLTHDTEKLRKKLKALGAMQHCLPRWRAIGDASM